MEFVNAMKKIKVYVLWNISIVFSGLFMLSAWILLVGIVTIISRYYKGIRAEHLLFGVKYWFQVTCLTLIKLIGNELFLR